MPQAETEDRTQVRRRLERDLARLDALDARRRRRGWVRRGLRGGLGAGAGFWTLVKLKLIGTLAGKLAVAALIGLGLAWPAALLLVLALVGLILTVVSLFSGDATHVSFDGCDDCSCACKRERVKRLEQLIAQRRAWLASPSGPAPSVRRDASARRRSAEARHNGKARHR